MPAPIETVCAVLLLLLVVVRAPAASRDPRARQVWLATVFGSVGLLCRGALISPRVLDALLGAHNWINLAQNLAATTAFWLGVASITGLVRERLSRTYLIGLSVSLPAITVPFIFIRKGNHTDGRTFIVTNLDQFATFAYVVIYSICIVVAAAMLLTVIRRRPSLFYIPFRVGAALVIFAGIEETVYAAAEHWQLLARAQREDLYSVFSYLFYPGLILILVASFLFASQRAWLRRWALILLTRISPIPAGDRPRPGEEFAALYDAVVEAQDAGRAQSRLARDALAEAEALLSRYVALQIPSFRRPVTYRPE